MSDHREAIAEVLHAHEEVWRGEGDRGRETVICRCGVKSPTMPGHWPTHREHLADALLGSDALAQIRAEARAEGDGYRNIARVQADVIAEMRARLARVEEIHLPSTNHGERFNPYCVGCWEAGGEDGAPTWPCPTIRALTAEGSA